MGGGDADPDDHRRRGVEGVRREFDRLHINPDPYYDTTPQFINQFNPFSMEPQAFPPLFDFLFMDPQAMPMPEQYQFDDDPFVFQPHLDALTQQDTLFVRRVNVDGLPPSADEQRIAAFFNESMAAIGGNTVGPGHAVCNVSMNHEGGSSFVEFRATEEASNAMALDGILFQGAPVKVRRPADYNPSVAAALGPSQPCPKLNLAAVGLTTRSTGGFEDPDRIFVGGLPYDFTEAQVQQLLETFGPVRGFELVKDRETGNSKGYAFCVYMDPTVTDIVCAELNGTKKGDKTLTVRRANQGESLPRSEQELQPQQQKPVSEVGTLPTKVVCLTQVVTLDELKDDEEYEDIMEDMRLEAGKYGTLVKVVIPRPDPSGHPVAGVGKVFLEYAHVYSAIEAKVALHGRKFDGKRVVAIYYPEIKFANLDLDG